MELVRYGRGRLLGVALLMGGAALLFLRSTWPGRRAARSSLRRRRPACRHGGRSDASGPDPQAGRAPVRANASISAA